MLNLKYYTSSKEKFLYGYYIIFLVAASLGAFLRFILGQYTIAALDVLAIFTALGLIYDFEKRRDVNASALLLFWIISPFLFYYIYHLGYGLQILQVIIIPFAAAVVLDTKTFIRHGTIFLLSFALLLGYGLMHKERYHYLQDNVFLVDFAIVFLLALAFSITYHRSINTFYTKLEETNALLAASNKQKTYLLQEIHHRVKNNLNMMTSILGLQEEMYTSKEIQTFIKQNTLRIKSISLVHELLYQDDNLGHINLYTYIDKLSHHVLHLSQDKKISLSLNIESLSLDSDDIIHLGIILNELLTNSIKYAFKAKNSGHIDIDLERIDDFYRLKYSDNGIGFNTETKQEEGFGLSLIKLSVEHLEGNLETHSDDGFVATIYFKGSTQ